MDVHQIFQWVNQYGFIITFILLVLSSPLITLLIGKKLEDYKENKQRRLDIFKTLLATRGDVGSLEHVKALNMLDVEFNDVQNVKHAWNYYRGHLNSRAQEYLNNEGELNSLWQDKRVDLLTDLLYQMAQYFKYDFDKNIIRTGAYYPKLHGDLVGLELNTKYNLNRVLMGGQSINVRIDQRDDQKVLPTGESGLTE